MEKYQIALISLLIRTQTQDNNIIVLQIDFKKAKYREEEITQAGQLQQMNSEKATRRSDKQKVKRTNKQHKNTVGNKLVMEGLVSKEPENRGKRV